MPFKFEIAPVVAGEISFYVELIIPRKFVPSENPEEETGAGGVASRCRIDAGPGSHRLGMERILRKAWLLPSHSEPRILTASSDSMRQIGIFAQETRK